MTTFKLKREATAFTLLELMIGVAIIAVMAAIAIPAFQKYMHEARTAEGTRMLHQAYRAKEANLQAYGTGSEHLRADGPILTDPDLGSTLYRPLEFDQMLASKPRFNLILGNSEFYDSPKFINTPSNIKYSLDEIPGFENLSSKINTFGTFRDNGGNFNEKKYMIGVEANLDGDDNLQVMAIDETGSLFLMCDDYKNSKNDGAEAFYVSYSLANSVRCDPNAGGGGGGNQNNND